MITLATFLCTFFFTAIITIIIRVSCINELTPIGSILPFIFSIFENGTADTPVGKITLNQTQILQKHQYKLIIQIKSSYTYLKFTLLSNCGYKNVLKNNSLELFNVHLGW